MSALSFLETRRPAWEETESLLKAAGRKGVAGLTSDQLHRLVRLYPAVAVDVARARMLGIDSQTQERINRLAIGAHGLLYRRPHVRFGGAILGFLRTDYPRLFRHLWPFMLLATALFFVASIGSYVAVRFDPAAAEIFVPHGLDMSDKGSVTSEDISERYRAAPRTFMAGAITTNNIQVAFVAFAAGIMAGLGTCWVLMTNGMMLGGFCGHFANHGLSYQVCAFLVPHGALEIFAILVAGAAGLRLGLSLAVPGSQTRMGSLRVGAKEAVLLVLGTIPMFVLAGCIESFVTPTHLLGGVKIVLGLVVLGIVLAYLLVVGRPRELPGARKAASLTGGGSI
jgi:uncharacterized membrane protein SpoIIM required for sporulation